MNRINLSDHQIRKMSRMYKLEERDSIIIYGKTMEQLDLVVN